MMRVWGHFGRFPLFRLLRVPRDRGDLAGFLETERLSQTEYGGEKRKSPMMKVDQREKMYGMRGFSGRSIVSIWTLAGSPANPANWPVFGRP